MSWGNGGEVLYLFSLVAGSLMCLAFMAWVRRALRWPRPGSEDGAAELHPYEIAALRSNPDQNSDLPKLVNVALSRMVFDGILAFDPREWTLSPRREPPGDAHPLERAIYTAVVADSEGSRFDAALIALLRGGALARMGGRKLRPGGAAPDADHPLEQAVYAAVLARPGSEVEDLRAAIAVSPAARDVRRLAPPGRYIEEVRRAAAGEVNAVRWNLTARGLVVSKERSEATAMGLVMLALCVGVPWLALVTAWEKQPLAQALLLPVVASLCGTLVLGVLPIYRTRRGAHLLARLKKAHAPLRKQWRTGEELVLALGLFGLETLTRVELAPLHRSQPVLTWLWRWLRTLTRTR